jgi:perosamine synthetase
MKIIPVNTPVLTGNEKKYLNECIDSGWISSEGPFIKRFETEFASTVGRKYAVAVSNGTAAIDIAVEALGIKKGDEVIMPTFTIISCINHIIKIGAIPVLIDTDPISWNMDVKQIEKKITPNTKDIIVVHIYGLPVDMEVVLDLATKYNLKIIEDAAEMHGQTYKGRNCGTFGDISTFSFYPNKHITTGEGGMVLTDDPVIAKKCAELRNLCFQEDLPRFVHKDLGWNYRMTNLQAAIGVAQLERLEEIIIKKRRIGKLYSNGLRNLSCLQLPIEELVYSENIYWVFGIVLKDHVPFDAKEAINKLANLGIGCRPFFWGMHEQPILKKMGYFEGQSFPVSENLSRRGFYIPSGLGLTDEQISIVIDRVHSIFYEFC